MNQIFQSATLVIETVCDVCSVALVENGRIVSELHAEAPRGHAERLLPMIATMCDSMRVAHILVDCGPGSFTGIRVGLAAALGLGLAWSAPVTGFSNLALLAALAFDALPHITEINTVTRAGHGEVFLQHFLCDEKRQFIGHNVAAIQSLTPADAVEQINTPTVVGNAAHELHKMRPDIQPLDIFFSAAKAIILPMQDVSHPAFPLYVRGADAKPQQ